MPNGRPGDNPLSDLTIHGAHPFPPDIEGMLLRIDALSAGAPADGRSARIGHSRPASSTGSGVRILTAPGATSHTSFRCSRPGAPMRSSSTP